MKAEIFIPGQTPSKKNSRQILRFGGKTRVVTSDFYHAWEQENLLRLKAHDLVGHAWRYPLRVGFHYIRKDRRRFDYNNLNQGILDLLTQAGIITNDDMQHVVPNGPLSYEVDKERVGVVVILEETSLTETDGLSDG